jgi:hypothetical protein
MKSIKFEEANTVYGKDSHGNVAMYALKFETPKGQVISCWELSSKERWRILLTGKLWMMTLSQNKPIPATFLSSNRKDYYGKVSDKLPWYKKLFS